MPPFGGYNDPDVERALEWMLSHIESAEWRKRYEELETAMERAHESYPARSATIEHQPISIAGDRIGWYLYLVDTALHAPLKYEPIQGARVLPIFKRLGSELDQLKKIARVDKRVHQMLTAERAQPDSALFELLVGLLWVRNGASETEFLEESPPEKRPDIRATIKNQEWFIECKRLSKTSEYSGKERAIWLAMWSALREHLVDSRLSVVLDIVFHVELETLPKDYLLTELSGKLPLVQPPCVVASNAIWDVSVKPVDYSAIRDHLKKYSVKYPSDQIVELIGGHRDPNRGFTSAVEGKFERMGGGLGNDHFLSEIRFAVGSYWSCDAERATEKKARDIRKHLAEAVRQLPDSSCGAVHVGLETLDGQLVEEERYRRIFDTVQRFDARDKDLQWVFCHLFQSYAPPQECWIIDETVYYFAKSRSKRDAPLDTYSVIIPEEEADDAGNGYSVHWNRPPP